MKSGSLSAWQKFLYVEMILISELVNCEIKIKPTENLFEMILVSKFMNSEIRIPSTLRPFCLADRLTEFHFEKPPISFNKYTLCLCVSLSVHL